MKTMMMSIVALVALAVPALAGGYGVQTIVAQPVYVQPLAVVQPYVQVQAVYAQPVVYAVQPVVLQQAVYAQPVVVQKQVVLQQAIVQKQVVQQVRVQNVRQRSVTRSVTRIR